MAKSRRGGMSQPPLGAKLSSCPPVASGAATLFLTRQASSLICNGDMRPQDPEGDGFYGGHKTCLRRPQRNAMVLSLQYQVEPS